MKTFLSAMFFISIAFSVFILNKDFSVKSVNDSVDVNEVDVSLVELGEAGLSKQAYINNVQMIQPSEVKEDNTQQSLSKSGNETAENGQDSFSGEKLITWVNDKEALAKLDQEMGLIEPTEYDQMRLESELNSAKRSIQNVETARSIALSEREPIPSNYPELDGVMLEEELPSSSTMDQY